MRMCAFILLLLLLLLLPLAWRLPSRCQCFVSSLIADNAVGYCLRWALL